jgi:hypothetical protein
MGKFTPFRPSYIAVSFQRAPRRPRHVPKRTGRADPRGDSICTEIAPPLCDANNHSRSENPFKPLTPLASSIQRESLFTPSSRDPRDVTCTLDTSYRLQRFPKRARRAPKNSRRTNRYYNCIDDIPTRSDVNAQGDEVVVLAQPTAEDETPCLTLYQGCELRQVVKGWRASDWTMQRRCFIFSFGLFSFVFFFCFFIF